MIVHIDGRPVPAAEASLPIEDGAVRFGDSLFETLKAEDGQIRFLDEHLDRIALSARLLDFPFDRDAAQRSLIECAAQLAAPCARLRLTLTRGVFDSLAFPPHKRARMMVTAAPAAAPTQAEREAGAACVLAPNRRVNPLSHLPQMKRGNYADCLYAANFAKQKGAREALFVTAEGCVLEGATSNLFAVTAGVLVTPPAGDLVLAGILRRQVLAAAARLGLPCSESPLPLDELCGADEAFLTNSLIDLLPLARLEQRPVRRGTLWRELLAEIDKAANGKKNPDARL